MCHNAAFNSLFEMHVNIGALVALIVSTFQFSI